MRGMITLFSVFYQSYNLFHFMIDVWHCIAGMTVFLDDSESLFYFLFVVEVHFEMNAVGTYSVKQGAQLVEGYPAGHDALAASQYLFIQVIPFRTAALWLADTGCPLDGVQFFNLKQGVKVMHGTDTVEVVQCVWYALTLLADKGLHEAAVVVFANHGRDVSLQL